MTENRINIGELDTLVTIQSCTISKGTRGQKTTSYETHSRAWAKIERDTIEGVSSDNQESGVTVRATMYKVPDMKVSWRINIEGTIYDVTALDPISRISPLCIVSLHAID